MIAATSKLRSEKQAVFIGGSDNACCVAFAESELYIIRRCAACGKPLTARWQKRCCSRSCAGRMAPIRPQAGALNGNFKGWRSKDRKAYQRVFIAANPEKYRVHRITAQAIRQGLLTRPAQCSACHKPCRPDGHHADYTAPLQVEWVCRGCHRTRDAARREADNGSRQ